MPGIADYLRKQGIDPDGVLLRPLVERAQAEADQQIRDLQRAFDLAVSFSASVWRKPFIVEDALPRTQGDQGEADVFWKALQWSEEKP